MWYIISSHLISSAQNGLTAMMYAVLEIEKKVSREKIVQLLIDGRADVNAQNQVLLKYC